MADEFAALGAIVPDHAIAEEDVFEIWDINVALFELFTRLETQWHMMAITGLAGGTVIRTGLDYAAALMLMELAGIAKDEFPLLQEMETAALAAWSEARR